MLDPVTVIDFRIDVSIFVAASALRELQGANLELLIFVRFAVEARVIITVGQVTKFRPVKLSVGIAIEGWHILRVSVLRQYLHVDVRHV